MKVSLPADPDGSWRASLTPSQRRELSEAARGEYAAWRKRRDSAAQHHRLAVVRTSYGFDVVGLRRAAVTDEEGVPWPDAWQVAWVDECRPEVTLCDHWQARERYGAPLLSMPGPPDRMKRSDARRIARIRRRKRRQLTRIYERFTAWVGSEHSFPEYDRMFELSEEVNSLGERAD